MSRRKIPDRLQEQVRQRARHCCEYCHASEQWQYVSFTVDHVVPVQEGGSDDLGNLALACFHCNRRKSNHQAGIDPDSKEEVTLFNPRRDRWNDHFTWSTDTLFILGISPTGRATVKVLQLNRERVLVIRAADKEVGRHPPLGDPIH
ncbi:MAG: HNH endonuclease signature motif containing protein [Cyanobacteriota bacterium]|nr:HNH endonuclease signature motif containing protein [Cyanobacteriota bacterium]